MLMVHWLRNSPATLLSLLIAAACQTPNSSFGQHLPHQRVSESIANKFTTTIPLKQCNYPKLWSQGAPPILTQPIRESLTGPSQARESQTSAITPRFLPEQKLTKLFDKISAHYATLGHTQAQSLRISDSLAPNAFIRHRTEVVLTRALVARVTDESELAFILAHEMAHVALGHGVHGGVSAEVEADALALRVVTALNFNPCSGSNVLERLGSPAKITLVSITPRLHALHDQTVDRCG
jgi:Zn-dependent protease with chaperone function